MWFGIWCTTSSMQKASWRIKETVLIRSDADLLRGLDVSCPFLIWILQRMVMDWFMQHCHNSAHSQTKFNEIHTECSLLPVASSSQFPGILTIMSGKNLGEIILFFNFKQLEFFQDHLWISDRSSVFHRPRQRNAALNNLSSPSVPYFLLISHPEPSRDTIFSWCLSLCQLL